MKKLVLAMALTSTAMTATAADFGIEVGLNASRTYGSFNENGWGLTFGKQFTERFGTELTFDRYTKSGERQNSYGALGVYELASIGPVSVDFKAGVNWLDNRDDTNGFAAVAGLGAELRVTDTMALTADWRYQEGQRRVDQFNGNTVFGGVKFSF